VTAPSGGHYSTGAEAQICGARAASVPVLPAEKVLQSSLWSARLRQERWPAQETTTPLLAGRVLTTPVALQLPPLFQSCWLHRAAPSLPEAMAGEHA
jgi:hypothetical protein